MPVELIFFIGESPVAPQKLSFDSVESICRLLGMGVWIMGYRRSSPVLALYKNYQLDNPIYTQRGPATKASPPP